MENDEFDQLQSDDDGVANKQIAALEDDLEKERDARKEERFYFCVVILILFNIVWFDSIEGTFSVVGILVLQLLILIPLARAHGVEIVEMYLNRVLNRGESKDE